MMRGMKARLGTALTAVLVGSGLVLAAPAQAASRTVYSPAECESAMRSGYTCHYSYTKGGDVTDYGRDLLAARANAAVYADVDYGPTTGWGHSDDGPGPTTEKGRAASVVSLSNANARMDCSGLTRYVYGALGIDIEWTNPETSSGTWDPGSANQPDRFNKLSGISAAQKGDLVWWSGHVAIYMGGNTIVESWNPGGARKVAFHTSGYTKANATFYRIKPGYID